MENVLTWPDQRREEVVCLTGNGSWLVGSAKLQFFTLYSFETTTAHKIDLQFGQKINLQSG